jgi:hypothetical protein
MEEEGNMRKKIVGIVILMLVTTTVVSATNTMNQNKKNQPITTSVDVPVYEVGDSWTYRASTQTYTYDENGSLYSTCRMNYTMIITVATVSASNYTIELTSKDMSGKFFYGPYKFIFTKFLKSTQKQYLNKTDLGIMALKGDFIKGPILWLITKLNIPIPAQLTGHNDNRNTPSEKFIPFPLVAGTSGSFPNVHSVYSQKCTLYWGLKTVYNISGEGFSGIRTYEVKMENITVPAGTYNAYNVTVKADTQHYWRSYYVPEVGSYAKRYI